ncbi:MAG TPA: lipopolysaccharide heptosyltransferase II [archaeon]|nr:lipopolysaccharide heptosyltransferase II [archaeon]
MIETLRAKKERELKNPGDPSILVVRFSSMGDILLTTPVLRALGRRWPGARVSFLTKSAFVPLLQGNPHVDEIIPFAGHGSLADLLALTRALSARRWDLLVDLHNSLRSRIVRKMVPADCSVVYPKYLLKRTLLIYCRLDLFGHDIPAVPERYALSLKEFGVELDKAPCELKLDAGECREIREIIAACWPGGAPFLAVAPGAAWPTKRWPAERFAASARELAGRFGLKVALLGSGNDSGACGRVADLLGEENALNLAGRLGLRASAAAVAASRLLLTNDTGLMHIATAVGTPVVALFGPTTRHLGYFPYRATAARVVEKKLWCRPCTHNGRRRCPLGHFRCMNDIGADRVVEAAGELLKDRF